MKYLVVDGHSIIFAWPELRRLHEQRTMLARDALVKTLTQYQDATGVHVAVVFDGKGGHLSETTEPGGIQIFYSSGGETADDVIERLAAKYGADHDLVVATNDLVEQQTVLTFGANCLSAEALRNEIEVAASQLSRELKRRRRRL
jgi:predicted RNA-binding protein with PIN domain